MGGGTSIWASPESKSDPKEIFNKKLVFLTLTTAFAGCAYGFDQGNIGGVLTFPAFRRTFGYDQLSDEAADQREGVVAGMCKFFLRFLPTAKKVVYPDRLTMMAP
jgi:hypothetical protein